MQRPCFLRQTDGPGVDWHPTSGVPGLSGRHLGTWTLFRCRSVVITARAGEGAGLKLHPDKCHFMQRQVTFLGHRVGREEISTVQDKVQAVADWPVPSTQKDLKSFLGLASYYQRFVRGFSCIAAPLFQLLHKDREFVWTDACQGAFD